MPELHITFRGTALAELLTLNVCILNCFLRAIILPIVLKSEFVDHDAESHCASCRGE